MRRWISLGVLMLFFATVNGQSQQTLGAAEIQLKLEKLNVLGSALYIAAHPDDENTRLIAYLANGEKIRTGYLSLTRGDGGQNLVGTEKGALLGIVRTQELLRARSLDKGIQFFTRANDFGYSKTAEETMEIWDEEQVLADMVWVIRKFKPDVLITRFPPPEYNYPTHGHHQASAILAEEAFKAAGDPEKFPEQLKYVEVWQPKRLYWNTSTWFYRRTNTELDPKGKIVVNVGAYDPLLGVAYSEVAAESRSQHQSQGFGAAKTRGEQLEYMEYVMGDSAEKSLFEDINTSWSRVKGGKEIGELVSEAIKRFEPKKPSSVLPYLLQAYKQLKGMESQYWVNVKLQEVEELIAAVSGLYVEAIAEDYIAVPGEDIGLKLNVIYRASQSGLLKSISLPYSDQQTSLNVKLNHDSLVEITDTFSVPVTADITHPYWLWQEDYYGMYEVKEQEMIGLPENPPAVEVDFTFTIAGEKVVISRPVMFKWTDRVRGELYRDFVISPEVTINIRDKVYVFEEDEPKVVGVTVKAWKGGVKGSIGFNLPKGWEVSPALQPFEILEKEGEKVYEFKLTPPDGDSEILLHPVITTPDGTFDKSVEVIDHPHIPIQMLFPKANAKAVKIDLKKKGDEIGYIMGAGDEVPQSLQQIGYEVTMINDVNFDQLDLDEFDAILVGIRAYNTHEWLVQKYDQLMEYVEEGGNLIVQYQTTWGLLTDKIGPYPFKIGRGRVTDEAAKMEYVSKNSRVLQQPNPVKPADFESWVQERGLYFAEEWDQHYQPVFISADPGEEQEKGSLLIAEYGKGVFMYTGISFFRQLPGGVSGAYRLLANMISYEHEE